MKKLLKLFSILSFVIISIFFIDFDILANDNLTVNVGFMHEKGYHEISSDGIYSGYGYEYLQMVSEYTDLNFEYKAYDVTDLNMLFDMLDKGDIDLITNISKNDERISKYAFSDKPMGNCATIISVSEENNTIVQGDFSTYNGMKVGLVDGMGFNQNFFSYAEQNGFTYEVYEPYFNNVSEAEIALKNGLIDALVYADFRVTNNEKYLDMIEIHDVYAITRKEGSSNYSDNDRKILESINLANDYLDNYEEGWRTKLKNKYFPLTSGIFYLSNAEKEVIRSYSRQGNKKLTVAVCPNMYPYMWVDPNEPNKVKGFYGLLFDGLINIASKEYGGIDYEVILPNTYEKYLDLISLDNPNRPDIILGFEANSVGGAQNGYISTEAYDRAIISRVFSKKMKEVNTVAYLKTMPYIEKIITRQHPNANIMVCDTADEVLDLIDLGIVDMFYTLGYSAKQYVYKDDRGLLREIDIKNSEVEYSYGVNNELPHELVSALSKYIRVYASSIVDDLIDSNTNYIDDSKLTFLELLYNYPLIMISIALSIVITIFMVIIAIIIRHNQLKTNSINNIFEMSLKITPSGFVQFIKKPNGEYQLLSANPAAIKMFGYDNESDFALNWYNGVVNSVYSEDRDSISRIYEALSEEQSVIHEEIRVIHNDGTLHILDGECAFIGYDKRSRIYLHTFRDASDEALLLEQREKEMDMMQQLEEALEKAELANSAKTIFLSNMSHDIRTPLNAIIGFLNILRKKIGSNSAALDTLDKVDSASHNLVEIINNVLDMSRIESGKEVISNIVFSPMVVKDEISAVYSNQALQKNIILSTTINIKYTHYFGDPLSLKKIMMNLISNAIKYTPNGGAIMVDARSLGLNSDGYDVLQFRVADNGTGMSDEFLSKIFQPFERELNTTQSGIRGTGLGLAIVKQLVDLLNGTITVESIKNVGTTFILEIPFLPADKYAKEVKEKEVEISISGFRLLVAEDNELNAEIIKDILEAEGAIITLASNGKEIYDMFIKSDADYYDAILMDVQMPIMDGCEATALIRKSEHPNAKSIPIIAITSNAFIEDIEKSMQSGMNAHISKPINIQLIKQKLGSLISK